MQYNFVARLYLSDRISNILSYLLSRFDIMSRLCHEVKWYNYNGLASPRECMKITIRYYVTPTQIYVYRMDKNQQQVVEWITMNINSRNLPESIIGCHINRSVFVQKVEQEHVSMLVRCSTYMD